MTTKIVKMSASVKKMLAITMILSSAMKNNKEDNEDYIVISQKLYSVVANTLAVASRKHTEKEFNYVRSTVIHYLKKLDSTPVSNSVVIGILFNLIGNVKLLNMYGLSDDDIKDTVHPNTKVSDIEPVINLLAMFDSQFNAKPHYSTLAPVRLPKKNKVPKTKRERSKPNKKVQKLPKNKKLRKLNENLAAKLAVSLGMEYRFDDDYNMHVVSFNGYDATIGAVENDTAVAFKSILKDVKEQLCQASI